MPTDPRRLRGHAPLLDAWLAFQEKPIRPFTIPGHKQRLDLVGDVVAGDVPLYAGLDSMKLTRGVLADAERRAAAAWGVDHARFSVGGSTHGNQTVALAVASPGDTVVVGRTAHRSMVLALVLAGLKPRWVSPPVDSTTGLPLGIAVTDLDRACRQSPTPTAIFLTDPSYVGTLGEVEAWAGVAHAHGIPLVVDAAWAAHFGFHPDVPGHALARGADAVVTSAHKLLPAYSQGAIVLARGERVDLDRLDAAFEATHTTSPAGSILASIDASRALLQRDGAELLGATLDAVRSLRRRLQAVPGLVVLDGPAVDPLKVTLVLGGTGADGNAVEADLMASGMPVELADRDTLVALVSLADTAETLGALGDSLVESIARHRGPARLAVTAAAYAVTPEQAVAPRDAFFAEREALPLGATEGRVSAELVAPYPPGIPVLAPGERVTRSVLDALASARASGIRIAYAADPTLSTLLCLRDG